MGTAASPHDLRTPLNLERLAQPSSPIYLVLSQARTSLLQFPDPTVKMWPPCYMFLQLFGLSYIAVITAQQWFLKWLFDQCL